MNGPLAFRNGRFVAPDELTLSHSDAGFVFGATVTDFCRTYRRRLFRWADHLTRLRRDCETCRIPLPLSDAELTAAAEHLVAHNAYFLAADSELAVVTFATPGPLGHLTGSPDNGPPTLGMHTVPIRPERYQRFFTDGVTLSVAGGRPAEPTFAKHRSRLPWWIAQQAQREPDAVPVLLDEKGIADTPIGAVLAVEGTIVLRPPVGTVLDSVSVKVVAELCERAGLRFAEAVFDLRRAEELLLAGSGFGVAGVRRVIGPGWERTLPWPGPVFEKLLAAWSLEVGSGR
jgi:branched-subunit amino acid aminotransferase/4-amino-4-deoxychorismate lyase